MRDIFFRRQSNILSAAAILMITYGVSHLAGLFKTRLLLSYFFGSQSSLLDVYYAAFVIPDTIFQLLIIGSLSAAFIPVFTRLLSEDKDKAWKVASSVLNIVILAFFVISLIVYLLAPNLSQLIAPGFSTAQISIMASLLRVMLLAQIFFAISSFFTGMIQSHQRFVIPALAPLAYNLGIIIGTVIFSPLLGILGPALGVVIGAFLHMIIQFPLAHSLGFRFRFDFGLSLPPVIEILKLLPPRAIALGVDQIEQFVSVVLASLLTPGSISLFNIARLLFMLPTSLVGVTIGQAALPSLSRQMDKSMFRQTLVSSFLQVAFLSLPISVLFIILRVPIVRIVFGTGSFPWSATLLTAKTLAILAVSASFAAIIQLVIRGFYALHDTRTPLYVGLSAALFDTVLGIILVKFMHLGILGIAIAISATTILECLALSFILEKKLGAPRPLESSIFKSLARMIFVSFVSGLALWMPMRILDQYVFDTTRTISLVLLTLFTSFIGAGVYIYLSHLFKIEELQSFVALAKRMWSWRKLLSNKEAFTEPVILPAPDQN